MDVITMAMAKPKVIDLSTIYGSADTASGTVSLADAIFTLFMGGGGTVENFTILNGGLFEQFKTDRSIRVVIPVPSLNTTVYIDEVVVFRYTNDDGGSAFFSFIVTQPSCIRSNVVLTASYIDGTEQCEIRVVLETLNQ